MRLLIAGCLLLSVVIISCSSQQVKEEKQVVVDNPAVINIKPREYNFKFVGYDISIDNPELDRRSYYKIIIDKIEAGRTTIGLESQKKTFEAKINSDRHLLAVEKWALDEKKGQYVKLNNIEQPKPAYTYFNLPEDRSAEIVLIHDSEKNKSEFQIQMED